LRDGDRAEKLIRTALRPAYDLGMQYHGGGGVYPNLFDAHPPFQIDGNFGVTAAIGEMLVQSHAGEIELLPALPAAWPEGTVTGLRARNAVTVGLIWKAGKLTEATVQSQFPQELRLRYDGQVVTVKCRAGKTQSVMKLFRP